MNEAGTRHLESQDFKPDALPALAFLGALRYNRETIAIEVPL